MGNKQAVAICFPFIIIHELWTLASDKYKFKYNSGGGIMVIVIELLKVCVGAAEDSIPGHRT